MLSRFLFAIGLFFCAGSVLAESGDLPEWVYFRGQTASFNSRYLVYLKDGQLWVKEKRPTQGGQNSWVRVDLPSDIDGKVVEISSDDEYIIAVSEDRRIYTMYNGHRDPSEFKWTGRWGRPLWRGGGMSLPSRESVISWDISYFSPREDNFYYDDAGNPQWAGLGVTTLYYLNWDGHNTGGDLREGNRITYLDPWLPPDHSYEVCGPERGRFRMVNLSASGSTMFVINRYGDIYTRLYDFDISGGDDFFFDYTYEPNPTYRRISDRKRLPPARKLPAPPWVKQPKIDGAITDRVTLYKERINREPIYGGRARILRVEGMKDGMTGFFQKQIQATQSLDWNFVPTGEPLQGRLLENTSQDRSHDTLAPSNDRYYVCEDKNFRAELLDFNLICSPAKLNITLSTGESFLLILHATEGIRQFVRKGSGLANDRVRLNGVIEVPTNVLSGHSPLEQRHILEFLKDFLFQKRFESVNIYVTLSQVYITPRDYLFGGFNCRFIH